MKDINSKLEQALDNAWHRQLAESSLERWLEICAKEGWEDIPDNLPTLVSIFGASWYFTRYVFYLGRDIVPVISAAKSGNYDIQSILDRLVVPDTDCEPEQKLEQLRLQKNGVMLQILVCYLDGQLSQRHTEQALTHLANATLIRMLEIFDLINTSTSHYRLAILGMGRMAGYEMSFGSDLDLIFLYEDLSGDGGYELSRKIRLLLRHLAMASSAGNLYEIDMRLRPHGTSGALLTTLDSFLDHHKAEREIWERQVMTRCRPVFDHDGLGESALLEIVPCIYDTYDDNYLRHEILSMRRRVEYEKGTDEGRINVKQGKGGLMDIDFITHYLQLKNGRSIPALRTCSTRQALEILEGNGIITSDSSRDLLEGYDFLKRVEACIRLFDMKSISTLSTKAGANRALSTAFGFGQDINGFMEKYHSVTERVRGHFTAIFEDPEAVNQE